MDEDSEVEPYILQLYSYEKLPLQLRKKYDKDNWKDKVIKYSLKRQLRWKTNLVKSFISDERVYYQEILKIGRAKFMLYPYHIADVLVKGLKVTPFRYYLEMMQDVMKNEYSYDRLPNFTATDCVRLLGIGRNEFIDTMNKCRAKGWLWKVKKNVVNSLLPTQPCETEIDYWWIAHVGFVSDDDIKNCTTEEHEMIDYLIDHGPKQAGELDYDTFKSLYFKQLIYLEVPIHSDDYIAVPPLENFVMNRVSGDFFENLLYKIFVSTDERISVEKLAEVLAIDIESVQQAVSVYCRLNFAKKKSVEPILTDENKNSFTKKTNWHISWVRKFKEKIIDENSNTNKSLSASDLSMEFNESQHTKRIGFFFDYTITALLMMGNLGMGLKSHAISMYEVGKLPDENMDEFLAELDKIDIVPEGEAQRYHDHAIALRNTIRTLRHSPHFQLENSDGGLDLLRTERINSLDNQTLDRILQKNYAVLISMAPISYETHSISCCIPQHFGPNIAEVNSPWFILYIYSLVGAGPPSVLYSKGTRVRSLPTLFRGYNQVRVFLWYKEPILLNMNNVLPFINESLQDGPIFAQAVFRDAPIIDIPFPFLESDIQVETEYNEENLWKHPIAQELQKALHLETSLGFLKMTKSLDGKWVPFEVLFGVPLMDLKLNCKVLKKIEEFSLFSENNMKARSLHSRELCLKLLDFIGDNIEPDIEIEQGLVPYPSKPLQFSDGKLSIVKLRIN